MCSLYARGRVFDYKALFWFKSQQLRAFEVGLRVRLALSYFVGGDEHGRYRETSQPQPSARQQASAGSNHAPAAVRNGAQQVGRAGHDNYTISIRHLPALYLSL